MLRRRPARARSIDRPIRGWRRSYRSAAVSARAPGSAARAAGGRY